MMVRFPDLNEVIQANTGIFACDPVYLNDFSIRVAPAARPISAISSDRILVIPFPTSSTRASWTTRSFPFDMTLGFISSIISGG